MLSRPEMNPLELFHTSGAVSFVQSAPVARTTSISMKFTLAAWNDVWSITILEKQRLLIRLNPEVPSYTL